MPNSEATYVFGGTFDPIHEGHIGVIREVLGLNKALVLAPTSQNPWKVEKPTPLDVRREMIELVLKMEGVPLVSEPAAGAVCVVASDYQYVADFVAEWRSKHSGNLCWVVGPDVAPTVPKWRDWDKLDLELFVAKSYAEEQHALDVREGRRPPHPAISDFIREKQLYLAAKRH